MSTYGAVKVGGRTFFKLMQNGEHVLLFPGGAREVPHHRSCPGPWSHNGVMQGSVALVLVRAIHRAIKASQCMCSPSASLLMSAAAIVPLLRPCTYGSLHAACKLFPTTDPPSGHCRALHTLLEIRSLTRVPIMPRRTRTGGSSTSCSGPGGRSSYAWQLASTPSSCPLGLWAARTASASWLMLSSRPAGPSWGPP